MVHDAHGYRWMPEGLSPGLTVTIREWRLDCADSRAVFLALRQGIPETDT